MYEVVKVNDAKGLLWIQLDPERLSGKIWIQHLDLSKKHLADSFPIMHIGQNITS